MSCNSVLDDPDAYEALTSTVPAPKLDNLQASDVVLYRP